MMTREAETETAPPAPEAAADAPAAPVAPAEPAAAEPTRAAPGVRQAPAAGPVQQPVPSAPEALRSRAGAAAAEPAAPSAPVRSEAEVQAATERARAEERHRIATIQEAARKLGVAASVADDLVARGTAIDAARAALIDAAAARDATQETRPHIRMGGIDAAENRRAAVEAALLHRYDPDRFALSEPAREWRGLSRLRDAIRHILLGGIIAAGMGSLSMAFVARWLHLPPEAVAAGSAAGSAAYLVGVFGPAFIEAALARIRSGKGSSGGDGDA